MAGRVMAGPRHADLVAQLPGTGSRPDTVVPVSGLGAEVQRPAQGGQPVGHALQAGAVPGGRGIESGSVVSDGELEASAGAGEADVRPGGVGVLGDVLQGLERAEVHGRLDVLRVALNAVGLNRDRHRGLARLGLQGEDEALVGEQRRVDAPGESPQVVERGPG